MVMNRDTSTSDDLLGTCKVALWEAIPNKVISLKKILDQTPNVSDRAGYCQCSYLLPYSPLPPPSLLPPRQMKLYIWVHRRRCPPKGR